MITYTLLNWYAFEYTLDTYDRWLGVVVALVLVGMMYWMLWRHSPRYLERAMARKMERRKIADVVEAALANAVYNKEISAAVKHKYSKQLGKALSLPDLIPRRRVPDVKKTKLFITRRLIAMGVDIASAVNKLRGRSQPSKKERVLRGLKQSKS